MTGGGPVIVPATQRAYEEIKARIMDVRFAPNEHYLEAELAAELGVSRTPIREAMVRLQVDGLVDVVPRRGIRIRPVSPDDLAQIYDVLALLEARAAELIAGQTPPRVGMLDDAVTAMATALEDDDLDAWERADDRFHRELVIASGNQYLIDAALASADRVRRVRRITLRLRPVPEDSVRDHAALVTFIRHGDGSAAFDAHLAHRRQTADLLVALLRRHSLTAV